MNRRKSLISMVAVLVLVLSGVVGWTLAYITHTSDPLTNMLKAGKTEVSQEEPSWKPDEVHPIVPGAVYTKDPTPTLESGSISSYIFMEVTASAGLRAILDGTDTGNYPTVNSEWTLLPGSTGNTLVYYYNGDKATFDGVSETDISLPPLFNNIKIKADATSDQLAAAVDSNGEAEITVVTKSVQQEGFTSAEDAYTAAFGALTTTVG